MSTTVVWIFPEWLLWIFVAWTALEIVNRVGQIYVQWLKAKIAKRLTKEQQ